MTHDTRDRLTIDTAANWRVYTTTLPAGATPIGVVTRGNGEAGALARIERTGHYVQVNGGSIRTLDGRKVAGALGQKRSLDEGKRINVYLDDASLAIAARLGDGNVSEGIRRALAAHNATR